MNQQRCIPRIPESHLPTPSSAGITDPFSRRTPCERQSWCLPVPAACRDRGTAERYRYMAYVVARRRRCAESLKRASFPAAIFGTTYTCGLGWGHPEVTAGFPQKPFQNQLHFWPVLTEKARVRSDVSAVWRTVVSSRTISAYQGPRPCLS